jgi:hypothetical protein
LEKAQAGVKSVAITYWPGSVPEPRLLIIPEGFEKHALLCLICLFASFLLPINKNRNHQKYRTKN